MLDVLLGEACRRAQEAAAHRLRGRRQGSSLRLPAATAGIINGCPVPVMQGRRVRWGSRQAVRKQRRTIAMGEVSAQSLPSATQGGVCRGVGNTQMEMVRNPSNSG